VPEPMHLPGNQCTVHGYHWPPVRRTVVHHIHPRGMLGPDVAVNRVNICGTGHDTIHTNIHALCLHGPDAPLVGTKAERALALRGYQAWVDAGKPGHPE